MGKVAVFLDVANLEAAFRHQGERIDYLGLRDFLSAGRLCLETFAYVPVSPYEPRQRRPLIDHLRRNEFIVRTKIGRRRPNGKWKANMDVEMVIDMMRFAHTGKADIFVVGSGDRDLMPAYLELRQLAIRVEVAATPDTVANDILTAASGFIDLGKVIDGYRAEEQLAEGNGRVQANRTS